jgi:hypothetical protein
MKMKKMKRKNNNMPMPRDYTIILNELVEDEILDAESVLRSLLNWMSEDEVYMFCQDEYDEITNSVYKAKYDIEEEDEED